MSTQPRTKTDPWDTIVVGGGVAGLSAALLVARSRRRVLVIDSGAPRNRFAAHMHGVLGNDGKPPLDFVQQGRKELASYGVEFLSGSAIDVTEIASLAGTVGESDAGIEVKLASGHSFRARTLIVASGVKDTLPAVPGLAERWGKSVFHCPFCDGWEVAEQRIGVLATSPVSLHQVEMLRQWSNQVNFLAFGAGPLDEAALHRLRARGIAVIDSKVNAVLGQEPAISAVRTEDGQEIEIDAIFTMGTLTPHDGFLAGLDLEREDLPFGLGSFLQVDATGKTSHPRIWAVGNVVNPMTNVPQSIGAGATTGPAVAGFLIQEDYARITAQQ